MTNNVPSDLNQYVRSEVPGLQYIAVTAERVLVEYAGGCVRMRVKSPISQHCVTMSMRL